ncbi:MAG: tetratricopeptide repeat protein [Acidobacteriota bacterium]
MTFDTHKQYGQAIKGVFSTVSVTVVGFGATKRRVRQTVYVYVEESPAGEIVCQPLSQQYVPLGRKRVIDREKLFKSFIPAPDIYLEHMLPALASLEKTVDRAESLRQDGALFSAEFEFKNALRLDEQHVRASFGLGLTYLDRGEKEGALLVFRRISRLSGATAPEHKHLFNEFGIKLRKAGMHKQAMIHYCKALRLSRDDEHLYYNLARNLYETGRLRAARRMLDLALECRRKFPEALLFVERIREKSLETIAVSGLELSSFETETAKRGEG